MRTRPGVTLIEVSIAALITAMTSAAVFSIVLSGLVSHEKADKRELAAMVIKRASQSLANYVSAVPSDSTYTPTSSPGGVGHWAASATLGWSLRGNAGGGVTHDISSLLNGTELQVPGQTCAAGNAYCFFTYTVVDYDCGLGTANTAWACKRVTFNLRYAD